MKDLEATKVQTEIGPLREAKIESDQSKKEQTLTKAEEIKPWNYYLMLAIIVLLCSIVVSLFGYMIYLVKELLRNRTVIYTCIMDPNEPLPQILNITKKFDYIVYTDNKYENKTWTYRKIPDKLKTLPPKKIEYYIKMKAHEFFPDYEVSIWIDHKVKIVGNLTEYLVRFLNPIDAVYMTQHPTWRDLYKEGLNLIQTKQFNDTHDLLKNTLKRYEKEGFPKKKGVVESRVLIRFHNYVNSTRLMDCWWDEVKNGPDIDFLLFSYVIWKTKIDIKYMPMLFYHKEYLDAGDF